MNSDERMRICLVSGTYPPAHCGVGDYTENLAQALADRADVSVVTSSYHGTPESTINPTVLPVLSRWSIGAGARVLQHILRTRPQIVHLQFPTTDYLMVPMLRVRPYPSKLVVTLHEAISINKSIVPGVYRPLRNWLSCWWSDGVIVVDESFRNQLLNTSASMRKLPWKTIPIVSNIPISVKQRHELERLREREGIPKHVAALSYFGFIQPQKGFEQLLDLLKVLRNRGFAAKMMIIGELNQSNPYHREMLTRIAADGLNEFITISGHLEQNAVSDYLAMSDACVLPFLDGVHPKRGSFLAARQQGTFVVTTSKTKKGLFPDENVYYAEPGDVEEMAKALQEFSGRRLPDGSRSARTWKTVADEHLAFFNLLLRESL